jgi:hypothetical protein
MLFHFGGENPFYSSSPSSCAEQSFPCTGEAYTAYAIAMAHNGGTCIDAFQMSVRIFQVLLAAQVIAGITMTGNACVKRSYQVVGEQFAHTHDLSDVEPLLSLNKSRLTSQFWQPILWIKKGRRSRTRM